jgi:hypothetical protein
MRKLPNLTISRQHSENNRKTRQNNCKETKTQSNACAKRERNVIFKRDTEKSWKIKKTLKLVTLLSHPCSRKPTSTKCKLLPCLSDCTYHDVSVGKATSLRPRQPWKHAPIAGWGTYLFPSHTVRTGCGN